jgi:uncharacterized protein (TIGR03382 family)
VFAFQLQVNDGHGGAGTSRVYVTVQNNGGGGGCSTGGSGSLAPLFGLVGLLFPRRRARNPC